MAGNLLRWSTSRIRSRHLLKLTSPISLTQLEDRAVPAIFLDTNADWVEQGPAPAADGQVSGVTVREDDPNTPENEALLNDTTGAVEALAPHPTDPNVLFAAGVNGGVWRTGNALAASPDWTPLTDNLPSLSVGALALNRAHPNQLLVGLGNYSSYAGASGDLFGGYFTTNAFDPVPTFRVLADPILHGQAIRSALVGDGYLLFGGTGTQFSRIGFPPSPGAVFRSIDGGTTFQSLSGTGGLPTGDVSDMVSDPRSPNRVIVATSTGLFRTEDITAAVPLWANITDLTLQPISVATDRIRLAIHSTDAGGTIIYAGVANFSQLAAVSWTSDLGATWHAMDLPEIPKVPQVITAATNASPIVITTASAHGYATGDRVIVKNVGGNLEANGVFTITVASATTFSLDGSTGTGVFSGSLDPASPPTVQGFLGVHPGNQGLLHFGFTADPVNPNILYVSGDRQDGPFPNGVGANNFTGSLVRGDRSQPAGLTYVAPSPQWTPITNNFAANDGAPHADSRNLYVDASGTLLDADDGGVYRRLNPTQDDGAWTSVNGDLALGQFNSARLDTVNNVIFGGTQDTGSIQQSAPGSMLWEGFAQGDGGSQEVDNTSTPGTVYRYSIGNQIQFFVRREFDSNNTLINNGKVLLADPATPTKAYSGIAAIEATLFGARVKYALNVIDPSLMMLGGYFLYEDNNPDPALGLAGDVVADVTPLPFTTGSGIVTALSYGGRQDGIPFTRIAHFGSSDGDLFVRGPNGPFTQLASPGLGKIEDIEVDPFDWRSFTILQENRVYRTTDGGSNFVDITNNLLGTTFDANGNVSDGLSTDLHTLALWDPTPGVNDANELLLAGGRGGVYSFNSSTGTWSRYGNGLPHVLVDDLQIYGNTLIAATDGRGIFRVDGLARIVVQGDANGNVMTLQADPTNPAFAIVSDGLGNSLRVNSNVAGNIVFQGLGGADTIQILGSSVTGGDLSFVRSNITVDAGGDPGDTLVIRNAGRTTPTTVTIKADSVGLGEGDNLFNSAAKVTYTGLGKGTLLLDLGLTTAVDETGNPVDVDGNSILVESTSAMTTSIIGTQGVDSYQIGTPRAVLQADGSTRNVTDLSLIGGAVRVDGRVAGRDALNVSDTDATSGNGSVNIVGDTIVGFAGPSDNSPISYTNLQSATLTGSNSAALAESFTLADPTSPVFTVAAQDGPDTVNVRSLSRTVNVDGGAGNDLIRVSSYAGDSDDGDLNGITGNLSLNGGSGDNRLIVSHFGSAVASNVTLTADTITGVTKQPITYSSSGGRFFGGSSPQGFQLRLSNAGNDTIAVNSTAAGSQTFVDGSGGADVFTVTAEGLQGDVVLRGSSGADQFIVNSGSVGGQQSSLRLSGGTERDTTLINGFSAAETANITLYDSTNGRFGGLGAPIDFDTQELLTYDGRGGRNNLNVVDSTGGTLGSLADPTSGIVYRPTGETSGSIQLAGGSVGPVIAFQSISGRDDIGLVVYGSMTGAGRDVLTILGTSDNGLGSSRGEQTMPDGSDEIVITDRQVNARNASGFLRPISLGRVGGQNTFSALVVYTGNEAGSGDRVTVTPSSELNIFVDGGTPTRSRNGDRLTVNSTSPTTLQVVNDPNLGPAHTRITQEDGASFGFTNFDNLTNTRSLLAVGADAGGGPRVQVYDAGTKQLLFDRFVYEATFSGGVRVATGDVTGDGIADLVTVAGLGGGPRVQVFDGVTFELVANFFAYEPSFRGGLYIAVGDVTGDGVSEIVTGTGDGGGPMIRIFDGLGRPLSAFYAFDPNFRGGVRVAVGDLNGDGFGDLIAGAGMGGGPLVRAFDGTTAKLMMEYFAFDAADRSGVYVAAGDLDGDSVADIVAGPGGSNDTAVQVRRSGTGEITRVGVFDIGQINSTGTLAAVTPNVIQAVGSQPMERGGIRVAVSHVDPNSDRQQIITGRGQGFESRVHAYNLDPLSEVTNLLAFPGFTGGIFVG